MSPPAMPPAPGLIWQDTATGTGIPVAPGKLVMVRYLGKFQDGKVFDASHSGEKAPLFVFVQGSTRLVPGWAQGIAGMMPGGKRTLTIPAALAYGEEGIPGAIPPNSTLVYEIEVVKVE